MFDKEERPDEKDDLSWRILLHVAVFILLVSNIFGIVQTYQYFVKTYQKTWCVASPKVNYTLIRKQSYLFATGTTYKTFGTFDMKRQLTRLHTPMYNWGKNRWTRQSG